MKLIILTLAMLGNLAQAKGEIAQFNPKEHKCLEMQETLKRDGTILVQGLFGYYDYYFRDGSYCAWPYTRPNMAYVPSEDTDSCLLGYVCLLKP